MFAECEVFFNNSLYFSFHVGFLKKFRRKYLECNNGVIYI
jgi:hypothetical protein